MSMLKSQTIVLLIMFLGMVLQGCSDPFTYSKVGAQEYFLNDFNDEYTYSLELDYATGLPDGDAEIEFKGETYYPSMRRALWDSLQFSVPLMNGLEEEINEGMYMLSGKEKRLIIAKYDYTGAETLLVDTTQNQHLISMAELFARTCGTDQDCETISRRGSILRYNGMDQVSFLVREKSLGKDRALLGFLAYRDLQYFRVLYEFPLEEKLALQQILFSLIINSMEWKGEDIVPALEEFIDAKPLRFKDQSI